jgi:holo-[acyl-carrier protein] synthase
MLTGLGHDLVAIRELASAEALREPGLFFTGSEHAHAARAVEPLYALAGLFAAKEAFFKAAPQLHGNYWTDVEVVHDPHGAPRFHLHGALGRALAEQGLCVHLSISHAGDYASAVVVVERAGAAT